MLNIKELIPIELRTEYLNIQSVKLKPREGWEEQFLSAGSLNGQDDLMSTFRNSFDEEELTW